MEFQNFINKQGYPSPTGFHDDNNVSIQEGVKNSD